MRLTRKVVMASTGHGSRLGCRERRQFQRWFICGVGPLLSGGGTRVPVIGRLKKNAQLKLLVTDGGRRWNDLQVGHG
jgi:hypothetical protein